MASVHKDQEPVLWQTMFIVMIELSFGMRGWSRNLHENGDTTELTVISRIEAIRDDTARPFGVDRIFIYGITVYADWSCDRQENSYQKVHFTLPVLAETVKLAP